MTTTVTVIGSGSWGTAITHLLGSKSYQVKLWSFDKEVPQAINTTQHNPLYLPDVLLPNTFSTGDFACALADTDAVVIVCPSAFVRDTVTKFADLLPSTLPCVILSKGIEQGSGLTMIEVLEDVVGNFDRLAALAGPNHAEEVSKDMLAATVVASPSKQTAKFFQNLFTTPYFRVYTSDDWLGVELCAAAKNIIAIANGMCVAMGLGDDASAALITRGLAEIARLVENMGGCEMTCAGLAGIGDLVVTCTSEHSRNRSLGEFLVAGGTLEEYEAKTHMVAEGAVACCTVTDIAHKRDVEMPIAETVRKVLWEGLKPTDAAQLLFNRPQKPERA